MIIRKNFLPRRTFLRGMGAAIGLPLLDAMVPALLPTKLTAASPVRRFGCVYVGNGAELGRWTPAIEGSGFAFTPILKSLEPLRDRLLVVTGLDNKPAQPVDKEKGGNHSRSSVGFMSGSHAKQTEGLDMRAGMTIDQVAARELCKDTQLPSLELALELLNLVGNCDNGYACSYVDSLSWRTPTTPLPGEVNPRLVFERLFGNGDTAEQRRTQRRQDVSILDVVMEDVARLRRNLGSRDTAKLNEYLDAVRDIEGRIARVESQDTEFDLPERPVGIPPTVKEHAELMFDLQLLAFQADITRVSSFMLARELSNQTYGEIGVRESHHGVSHHGFNPEKMAQWAKINTYHVELFANFLKKLQSTPDGDGTLLDHSLWLYGGGISDGHYHVNLNVPVLAVGGATFLSGGRHLRYPKGTPLANLFVTLMDRLGVSIESFGDSTGKLEL